MGRILPGRAIHRDAALALGVKRVVANGLAREDFRVAEAERAETGGDPAQTLTGRVRLGGMRIGGPDDLTQEREGWIGEPIFLQH